MTKWKAENRVVKGEVEQRGAAIDSAAAAESVPKNGVCLKEPLQIERLKWKPTKNNGIFKLVFNIFWPTNAILE